MHNFYKMGVVSFAGAVSPFVWLIIVLSVWEGVWKGLALWRSGRSNQIIWFVFLFLFNTAGILPIVYLIFFSRRKNTKTSSRSSRSKPRRR